MLNGFNIFSQLCEKYGLSLNEKMYDKFDCYAQMLVEWNEKMNLTAITEPDDIMIKHFLDSMLIFCHADIKEASSVADIGTGAGFPGIPMKIYREDISLTLIDSLNKRIGFLEAVSEKNGLGAVCIHTRAEDGGRKPELREKFDVATARAVAAMPVLCEYCLPYVKKDGIFVAMKGPNEDIKASEKAVGLLGGKIEQITEYKLEEESRVIAVIRKIRNTPEKYPRNSGQIKKKSL